MRDQIRRLALRVQMASTLAAVAGCLLLAAPLAMAADGDEVASGCAYTTSMGGDFNSVCIYLCEGQTEAEGVNCDVVDLGGFGAPTSYIFSREAVDSDCTGDVTADLIFRSEAGGTPHTFTDLQLNDATTAKEMAGPPPRFAAVTLANLTGCDDGGSDDGVDIYLHLFYAR